MTRAATSLIGDTYPQRLDQKDLPWLDRMAERLRTAIIGRVRVSAWRRAAFVRRVDRAEAAYAALDTAARGAELMTVRLALRAQGPTSELVARAFGMIRAESQVVLGLRHFGRQIEGAYALVNGNLVEMDTGEGKSLTATLAAATMALAGRAVHVITVNDYLARRDAERMAPLYARLGLSTGVVTEGMDPARKAVQYRADIVYGTSKTVTFDYLRDGIEQGGRTGPLRLAVARLSGGERAATLLRGLAFAIVDEADSIFIDEARTPLIISAQRPDPAMVEFYRQALDLASELEEPLHFTGHVGGRDPELTVEGCALLEGRATALGGLWTGRIRREEAVRQALMALHGFRRDIDYIVRDGKVMIVDENTGRVMPDRAWERGLHQLIELREGVEISPEKETLARISFQLFFRRYVGLSGMSGTLREVAGEIGEVYGLPVVRVQPRQKSRRRRLPPRIFAATDAKWDAVVQSVRERIAGGQPVLVGTRSIAASEIVSTRLAAAGIPHQLLNAKQDAEEAEIVGRAGAAGRVTIATNMAGRGTDIELGPGVEEAGGLHVILTEGHDNARVDRQLIGRCGRQGDPGTWQALLSLEDEVLDDVLPRPVGMLRHVLNRLPRNMVAQLAARLVYRLAQRRVERAHRRIRRRLLTSDYRLRQSLSFSGRME